MPNAASLVIEILAKTRGAVDGLDKTADSAGRMQRGVNKAAGVAAAGLVAVAGAAMECAAAASEQQQAFGGLEAVFGTSASQMKEWAKGAAQAMGLSASAYATGATRIGGQLKSLGMPMGKVTGKTNELMQTAADLAAQYGGSTTDAIEALGSAMRGEADPAEKYNLQLSQTKVNAQMAADGTDKLTGKAKEQAKTQAILKMITEQSGDALGAFGRESESAAGSAAIAQASFDDAKAALGNALLPALTEAAKALTGFAEWASQNSGLVTTLAGVLGVLALAIMGVAAAQWIMNAAILANPMTWIVIAIVAAVAILVAMIIRLAQNWDQMVAEFQAGVSAVQGFFASLGAKASQIGNAIKSAFAAAWNWVKAQARGVVNFIKSAFATISAPIRAVSNAIKAAFNAAFNALKSAVRAVSNAIKSAFAAVAGPIIAVANRIKSAFVSALNGLKSAAGSAAAAIMRPFNAIGDAIRRAVGAVQDLIGWISRIKIPSISIPGFNSTAAGTATTVRSTGSPTLTARTGRATSTASGGVVINVNGALDPEGVARQIRTILSSASVRRQGVVLAART